MVTSYLKDKIDCECGDEACNAFGTPKFTDRFELRHVKTCACARCKRSQRGRRSQRKGARAQAKHATAFGAPRSAMHAGHEETLPTVVRMESKAGRQVQPIETRFSAMERQSEAGRAVGDHRPFVGVAEADDVRDPIVMVRLSSLHELAAAIAETWGTD